MLWGSSVSFTRSGSKRLYRNAFSEIRFVEELCVFCPARMALLDIRLLEVGRSKMGTSLGESNSAESECWDEKEKEWCLMGVKGGVDSRMESKSMCAKKGWVYYRSTKSATKRAG